MADQFRYPCKCGKALLLNDNQVGKHAVCSCGARIRVTRDLLDGSEALDAPEADATLLEPTPGAQAASEHQPVADADVPLEWNVGDVIQDLYEVLPVTVGSGDDAEERDYHEGGMGRVYRVRHIGWGRDLAVKCPRGDAFTSEDQKANFTRECESWMELGLHPHIASCFYVKNLGGIPRIFAEYVGAGSLKDWIEHGKLYEGGDGKQVLGRMLDIAIQSAWGLHYAHEKGIIHQDVKPHNVMLTSAGTAKVVDFGLARAKAAAGLTLSVDIGQSIMVTHAGGYTPAYCSPEQISGEKLTRRTDTWSWGLSVLEMFTGPATWESGLGAAVVLKAFLEHNEEDDDLGYDIPPMPSGVADLLAKCFQTDEADRPHTMIECAEALASAYREAMSPIPARCWNRANCWRTA